LTPDPASVDPLQPTSIWVQLIGVAVTVAGIEGGWVSAGAVVALAVLEASVAPFRE
jgi:hypothetical protein